MPIHRRRYYCPIPDSHLPTNLNRRHCKIAFASACSAIILRWRLNEQYSCGDPCPWESALIWNDPLAGHTASSEYGGFVAESIASPPPLICCSIHAIRARLSLSVYSVWCFARFNKFENPFTTLQAENVTILVIDIEHIDIIASIANVIVCDL